MVDQRLCLAFASTARSPLGDPAGALLCDSTPAVLQLAVLALEASSLRGMDAIHIAAAQVCEADVFVSADARQCAAAQTAGLHVVAL